MDQAALVRGDRVTEAQILDALDRARLPVAFCKWNYAPNVDEWELIIATPWYDSKGYRTAMKALIAALDKAGIYRRVPIRRVTMKSPGDPLVKALQQETKSEWDGFIHVLRHPGNGQAAGYSCVFAPVTKPTSGGVRRFSKLEDLKSFLLEEIGLGSASVQSAVDEMSRHGAGEIYPVSLTTRQMKKLGVGQLVFATGRDGVFRIIKVKSGSVNLELADVRGQKVWRGKELENIPFSAISTAPDVDSKPTPKKQLRA